MEPRSVGENAIGHDSPTPEIGSVTGLLANLAESNPAVLAVIWRRFFPRMAGLARKTLAGLPHCGVDADDVAQSAFISFWQALDRDRSFEWNGRDDLWRILAVITSRKALKKARRESAQKRGGGSRPMGAEASKPVEDLSALSPVEFDLICEEMLLGLDRRPRTIALLRLQGHAVGEIAERIGCSTRSVERDLAAVRTQWSVVEPE